MNKIKFISNQKDQNGRFDITESSKNAEVSLKFTPGQMVYVIEDSKVIKRRVISVEMNLNIFSDHYDCETKYFLNNSKQYLGHQLHRNLEDIEIVDDSNVHIENLYNAENLASMIRNDPEFKAEEMDPPF